MAVLTLDDAVAYIAKVRWQFATTMPQWPHEYTVKAWRPELTADFEDFCRLIAEEGFVEPWPPPPDREIYHNHYLVVGDHKYWAMGEHGDQDPPERMTVVNRAVQRRCSGGRRASPGVQDSSPCP